MAELLRILLLEDNPVDADLMKFELEEAEFPFTLKVVESEEDFIRAIQEFCPDLILSDDALPKYDGSSALAEAKSRCPDVPFILVGGAVTEERAIDLLTRGARDYVLKNRLQRLIPAVRRGLEEIDEQRARGKREAEIANLASFPLLNPAPIIETDPAGAIHFCNPAAERLFPDLRQRGREHPLLADWGEVVRSFGEAGMKEHVRELNILGRWYQETIYFIEETGRIRIYGRDITLRREAEIKLADRAARLEEANRELESFSYSVSHDLKAPLSAIDGYSRMLIRKHGDEVGEDAARMLGVIRSSIEKMNMLIDDLLSFSRVLGNSMTLSEIDMGILAGDVWNDIRAANREREIEFRVANLLPGFGDRTMIRQALFNLLSNAVKFTRNRRPGVIEMTSHAEPGRVVYCLKDNGAGFDMTYYDKLFGVFKRLHSDEEFEGTGVGLAIVRRIVQRHGGEVWAEGRVGQGATFRFSLPLREGESRAAPAGSFHSR